MSNSVTHEDLNTEIKDFKLSGSNVFHLNSLLKTIWESEHMKEIVTPDKLMFFSSLLTTTDAILKNAYNGIQEKRGLEEEKKEETEE